MTHNRGQVWIETVLYTLIGLSLIALVLSYVYPKVQSSQERILVDQTRESLASLDEVILTVNERGPGNIKTYDFTMKKGTLVVDGFNDEIFFVVDGLDHVYSEPGVPVQEGRLELLTQEGQKKNNVKLKLVYKQDDDKGIDIKVNGKDIAKSFTQAPLPYKFSIHSTEVADTAGKITRYIDVQEGSSGGTVAPSGGSGTGGSPSAPVCGNGVKEGSEECDLGDSTHGNGNGICPSTCNSACQGITCQSGQPPANTPPMVSVTKPSTGSTYSTVPATVLIEASASDNGGTVSKVEFFADDGSGVGSDKIGEDTTAPYAYSWNVLLAGIYSITAKATDNGGLSTISSPPVQITVAHPVQQFELTVRLGADLNSGGQVTSNPSGINCQITTNNGVYCSAKFNAGTPITLTPTANSGSRFQTWYPGVGTAEWQCDSKPAGDKCVITLDKDRKVWGLFEVK